MPGFGDEPSAVEELRAQSCLWSVSLREGYEPADEMNPADLTGAHRPKPEDRGAVADEEPDQGSVEGPNRGRPAVVKDAVDGRRGAREDPQRAQRAAPEPGRGVGVLDQGLLDHRLSLRVGRLERLAGPALEMAHRAERGRDPEEVLQGRGRFPTTQVILAR